MSLLFDALKRAQGDDAKPVAQTAEDSAKQTATILAASNRTKSNVLPYAAAGIMLLSGMVAWYFYQTNQYTAISTQHTTPDSAPLIVAVPTTASQPVAASSVAQTIAGLPATGAGAPAKSAWTHPVAAKKSHSKKHPRKIAKPASLPASDPLKEAYLALSEGSLDQAEIKYLAVLLQSPHEKDALLGLAVIAQRKLQTERAADLYHQVLREDLGNSAAAAGLVSLSAKADPVAAESQLRELLDIKPTAHEFHYALGGVLARQQRWGEAQQAFFHAYSLTPDNALYAYNLAISLDRLHQPAAALPFYEKASQLAKPGDTTINLDAVARRIKELENSR
jgi:tetratricopeptide (TPR) repeat protein